MKAVLCFHDVEVMTDHEESFMISEFSHSAVLFEGYAVRFNLDPCTRSDATCDHGRIATSVDRLLKCAFTGQHHIRSHFL